MSSTIINLLLTPQTEILPLWPGGFHACMSVIVLDNCYYVVYKCMIIVHHLLFYLASDNLLLCSCFGILAPASLQIIESFCYASPRETREKKKKILWFFFIDTVLGLCRPLCIFLSISRTLPHLFPASPILVSLILCQWCLHCIPAESQ